MLHDLQHNLYPARSSNARIHEPFPGWRAGAGRRRERSPNAQASRHHPGRLPAQRQRATDNYAIERVVVEPLPWPGDLAQNSTRPTVGRTGSKWRTPRPASCCTRAASRPFSANGAAPTRPARPVAASRNRCVSRRSAAGQGAHPQARRAERVFGGVEQEVDADALEVIRKQGPAPAKPIPIRVSGPSPTRSIC